MQTYFHTRPARSRWACLFVFWCVIKRATSDTIYVRFPSAFGSDRKRICLDRNYWNERSSNRFGLKTITAHRLRTDQGWFHLGYRHPNNVHRESASVRCVWLRLLSSQVPLEWTSKRASGSAVNWRHCQWSHESHEHSEYHKSMIYE